MSRTPIDVYRGLTQTRLGDDVAGQIGTVVGKFSDYIFAGQKLSIHLTRFVSLCSKLVSYLDSRYVAGLEDLTIAIDILDHLTSTTKWWSINRKNPGFVLRPRIREPREFMKSIGGLQVGSDTLNRISTAADKLARFMEEHGVSEPKLREGLCEVLVSTWVLLSAFICKNQGRTQTAENDFEVAYDFVRVLLFYTPLDDLRALVASRRIATNPILPKAANVSFSNGFDRKLESSMAARLEREHSEMLTQIVSSTPSVSRNILTNSLKLLTQLEALSLGYVRIEEEHYEPLILASIQTLEKVGISSDNLNHETSVLALFQRLKPDESANERIALLARRFEGLMIDSTGNRDFLLRYARLVPRLISLLILIIGTSTTGDGPIQDSDIKRGLILLSRLLNSY